MVRSNRGRAAALRHVWAWPLHSARRFAVTVVVVLLVIVVGGKISRLTIGPTRTSSTPAAVVSPAARKSPAPLIGVTP
jgi:hypothetical protein